MLDEKTTNSIAHECTYDLMRFLYLSALSQIGTPKGDRPTKFTQRVPAVSDRILRTQC